MKSITLALLLVLFGHIPTYGQKQQTVSVQGKVYATHFGALLSGIELKLLREGRAIKSTKTDTEGNYLINDIRAGKYSILIGERGFVSRRLNIELADGEQKILDIDLEVGHLENYSTPQEFNITGTVMQSNGKPLPRASVVIVSPFNANRMSEAKTDEKGQYKLPAMEGQFLVYAYSPGFMLRSTSVLLRVVSTTDQRTISFVLEPFGSR